MNMKKVCMIAAVLLLSATSAFALPYMCFYTSGSDTPAAIGTVGLSIDVNDTELTAANTAGEKLTFPLNTLTAMEFSWDTLSVGALPSAAEPCTVYTLDGLRAGEFTSLEQALAELPAGLYVINTNGKSVKILIGK